VKDACLHEEWAPLSREADTSLLRRAILLFATIHASREKSLFFHVEGRSPHGERMGASRERSALLRSKRTATVLTSLLA
jgi:hypothetical protein